MTPQNYAPPTPILPDLPIVNFSDPSLPLSEPPFRPYSFSPLLLFVIGALGSLFLVIGYYQIILKYCSSAEHILNRRIHRRSLIPASDEAQRVSNPGLDPWIIARIPVRPYNSKDAVLSNECSVCLAEFRDGEIVRVLPICGHSFHIPCIGIWLHAHSTCPVCRADLSVAFSNLIHSARKDEQRHRIESQARSGSVPFNGISQGGNGNERSLGRGETESGNFQWYRRFVWSTRAISQSPVRFYRGDQAWEQNRNRNGNRNNGSSSQEAVVDLAEPSQRQ